MRIRVHLRTTIEFKDLWQARLFSRALNKALKSLAKFFGGDIKVKETTELYEHEEAISGYNPVGGHYEKIGI